MAPGIPAWLAAERRAAREDLARSGLPGPRDEAWKYTSLKALEARTPRVGDAAAATRDVDLAALSLPGLDGPRLVFVNGAFRADLSRLDDLPEGLVFAPLARVLAGGSEQARVAFSSPFAEPGAAMARLNTALAADGVWLEVADGASIEAPIHLVFIGADAGTDIAWHLRNVIRIGAGGAAHGGRATPRRRGCDAAWQPGRAGPPRARGAAAPRAPAGGGHRDHPRLAQ